MFSESINAQSSPPLLLNDPGTPGSGKWEINIMTALEHSDVNDEWQILLFDINYGLGDRGQIAVSLPYVVEWREGVRNWLGFDGVELGFKYRFLNQTEILNSDISFYPKIYFPFEPEASWEFSTPFEFHKDWSDFGLTAEIGYVLVQDGDNRWEGGCGLAIFFNRIKLLWEWHTGVREAPLDLTEPMVNVGLTWDWLENVSLYFSFGKSIHGDKDETNLWSLCGVQLLF